MKIEDKIQDLQAKYEDKGGILAFSIGIVGINIYVDPDERDDEVIEEAVKLCDPFGCMVKETKMRPDEAEKMARSQLSPDADLGCISAQDGEVVYCFYFPGIDVAKNYVIKDDKLVEHENA